ncbi:unnamed protein product [Rhizoctonia solani]|uniref:Uncharacterized protein n=1 Tax=Rhizoctonia solani TaxID=456999 RepID=A0A8H3DJX9_9AGAM|nr:unnamed protein product [Rhizoctonia solani]
MAPPTKFGPKLDFYLATCRERAPLDHAPDKEEIIRAIASLADPLSVSYTTFETILALERSPLCAHASILLTGSHILPSCIQLLRQYCSGRTQLFDYAYGYLCFQLMNLSIEVAKLAQVNALPKFLHILKSSSRGTRDKAITEELAVHVREWEAKEFTPGGQFLLPASNLLGWGIDPPTRMPTALPGIGGFTILDTVFLMEKIWESRGKFLRCLRSALRLQNYAGWCGIFHLMHDTLVRMHGMSHINGQEFDEYQNWITFTDIMQRYSLCANHYEEPTVSYLIKNRPNHQREKLRITALDPADVDQIVGAYINKARQQPSIVYAHATRLFAFAMTSCHLDKSKFVTNVTRITEAALADSWARFGQMRGGSTGLSFWANFSDSVINTLILVPALNKIADLQRQTILKIIVNENLLDFLGYFVLYPLTTKDKTIIAHIGKITHWKYCTDSSLSSESIWKPLQ